MDLDVIKDLRSDSIGIRDQMLEKVYVKYFPIIRNFISDNNGNDEDAQDVFQDAIIIFYSKVRNPDFELSCTVKTYLYSVARNLWLNKLRKNNKIQPLDNLLDFVELPQDTFEILKTNPEKSKVQRHLAQLCGPCREVLELFYFHRMSMHSIAQEMGLANEQVAKNKKSKCLKKLKNLVFNYKANTITDNV